MKKQLNELQNADVSSMDKTQLDEYRNKLQAFRSKTAFICNTRLIKTIYMILGYILGISLGVLIARTFIFGSYSIPYIIIMVVLLVLCIAVEVLYRLAKAYGAKCSKCFVEKSMEVKNQYALIAAKQTTEQKQTTEIATEKEQPENVTTKANQNSEQPK